MGVRPQLAEISDFELGLQREGTRHDFAENGSKDFVGEGALVEFGDPTIHFHFPVGSVKMHLTLGFDGFYFQHIFRPLV